MASAAYAAYALTLDNLLDSRPELRRLRKLCQHCGIVFVCDPRNAGRDDLRCHFGCQEAHRKRQSNQRSTAYYRTPEGKIKKKIQNGKRVDRQRAHPNVVRGGERAQQAGRQGPEKRMRWMNYLGMVLSQIERREVSKEEVASLLSRKISQHSMVFSNRAAYMVFHEREVPD